MVKTANASIVPAYFVIAITLEKVALQSLIDSSRSLFKRMLTIIYFFQNDFHEMKLIPGRSHKNVIETEHLMAARFGTSSSDAI